MVCAAPAVNTRQALQHLYFFEGCAEGLDANLPCRVSGGGEFPGLLKRLCRNIHSYVSEDLGNL